MNVIGKKSKIIKVILAAIGSALYVALTSTFLIFTLPTYSANKEFMFSYTKISDSYTVLARNRNNNVKSIAIPDKYLGCPVTGIAPNAFAKDDIEYVQLPPTIKTIGAGAFKSCEKLQMVFLTNSIESIGNEAFSECTNFTNFVRMSQKNLYIGEVGDKAFKNCKSITQTAFDSNTKSIGAYAYSGCDKLAFADVSSDVKYVGKNAFPNNESLTIRVQGESIPSMWHKNWNGGAKYVLSNETTVGFEFVSTYEGYYVKGYSGNMTEIEIPSTYKGESVVGIADSAFRNNHNIKSIKIPSSVTKIGNYAFSSCTALENVILPVTLNKSGFCAFSGCTKLKSIDIPTSLEEVSSSMFSNCTSLKNVTFSPNVRKICGQAFLGCTSLSKIELPNSIREIEPAAFENCKLLNNVRIPDYVTEISGSLFSGCSSLSSIDLNNVEKINAYAFSSCSALKNFDIGPKIKSILSCAFERCEGLETLYIPKTVERVGRYIASYTNITFYCEAESLPEGWDSEWNGDNPVIWGYKMPVDQ